MKRVFTYIILLMFIHEANAQAPDKMSYQAVIRNADGSLATDQAVGMRITVLQGSASGTNVYLETHNTTTNANGLLSIVIGEGTTSDDFSLIDWSTGPYFLQVETDLSGGTSYTLSGTSQLLSVPYALHAKTVETILENDPVYTASEAVNITAADITNLDHLSGINTGDQDLGHLAAKSNVLELNNTSAFTPDADYEPATKKYVDDNKPTTYSIGDFAHGGIVFWVDETGMHGLVCAKEDQNGGDPIQWYNGTNIDTEAHGDGLYSGAMNTWLIVADQGSDMNDYAAGVCAYLRQTEGGTMYGDWYLPSVAELSIMYDNKDIIDATAVANGGSAFYSVPAYAYWTSCEMTTALAMNIFFHNGNVEYGNKYMNGRVRAIRAF